MLLIDLSIDPVVKTAESISNFGIIITVTAFFLILTFVLWVTMFKWFKKLVDEMVTNHTQTMNRLLDETKNQNDKLDLIREGLEPELFSRVRTLSNALFDLASWHALDILRTVKKENHIVDHEATRNKLKSLLTIEYQGVISKLDNYGTYKGKKLSSYTKDSWVELVAKVLEDELYNENGENLDRAITNVTLVFDRVKIEYYKNIKN